MKITENIPVIKGTNTGIFEKKAAGMSIKKIHNHFFLLIRPDDKRRYKKNSNVETRKLPAYVIIGYPERNLKCALNAKINNERKIILFAL